MGAHASPGTNGGRRKRVLMGWEFGGGLGHLVQTRLLACDFLDAGYEVFVAVASPQNGARVFWEERDRPLLTLLRTPTANLGAEPQ